MNKREIFENEFDDVARAQFLFFATGTFKLPHGGFKAFGFEISKAFDLKSLPIGHTCFN